MRNKYDFSLKNSDSRRDIEKYFYKYGWSKTLKRLKQVLGKITEKCTFNINNKLDCTHFQFEHYFSTIEIIQEKQFPFRKDIHILY